MFLSFLKQYPHIRVWGRIVREDFIKKWIGKNKDEIITEDDVQIFINKNVEENLNLEYKSIKKLNDFSELQKEISAFANSDGGLLCIGISEHKEGTNTYPEKIEWNKEPKKCKEWFQDNTINRIRPEIPGVRIVTVNKDGGNIFLVDVPASENPPHMAYNKYYQRNNFEAYAMEHYQVADAFGKRKRPILRPFIFCRIIKDNEPGNLIIEYGLSNVNGRALAKWPMEVVEIYYASASYDGGLKKAPLHQQEEVKDIKRNGISVVQIEYTSSDIAIYPASEKVLGTSTVRCYRSFIVLKVSIGAEDAPTETYLGVSCRECIYKDNDGYGVKINLVNFSDDSISVEEKVQRIFDGIDKMDLDQDALKDMGKAILTAIGLNWDDRYPLEKQICNSTKENMGAN